MEVMRVESVGGDGSPSWIWRASSPGKLGIDEVALIRLIIDQDEVPRRIVQCFLLNVPALVEAVGMIPWGARLWSEVYKFAEQIVDASLFAPRRSGIH